MGTGGTGVGQRLPTAGVVAVHGAMSDDHHGACRVAAWNVREEGRVPRLGWSTTTVAGEQGTRTSPHGFVQVARRGGSRAFRNRGNVA